jgi:hypothetical protein
MSEPLALQRDVHNHQHSTNTETTQAQINAGEEGWLAPAQYALLSTLNEGTLSGGKPPFLTAFLFA